MKISIELTLTPLKKDFIPTIKSFILQLEISRFYNKREPFKHTSIWRF